MKKLLLTVALVLGVISQTYGAADGPEMEYEPIVSDQWDALGTLLENSITDESGLSSSMQTVGFIIDIQQWAQRNNEDQLAQAAYNVLSLLGTVKPDRIRLKAYHDSYAQTARGKLQEVYNRVPQLLEAHEQKEIGKYISN